MSVTKISKHSYCEFRIDPGRIGQKEDSGLDVCWEIDDGRVYLVFPCCFKIQAVPNHLIDRNGYIGCMYCGYCRSDHVYWLNGWRERTSPAS